MKLPVEYSISSNLIQNPDCSGKMECRKGATTYISLDKLDYFTTTLVTRNLVEFSMTPEIPERSSVSLGLLAGNDSFARKMISKSRVPQNYNVSFVCPLYIW